MKITWTSILFGDDHFKWFWNVHNKKISGFILDRFALRSRHTEPLEEHGCQHLEKKTRNFDEVMSTKCSYKIAGKKKNILFFDHKVAMPTANNKATKSDEL